MSDFIPVICIGAIYTLLALPHIVAFLCCRRDPERAFSIQGCAVSYAISLVASSAIVLLVSKGASAFELTQFFVPFWIVILVWWATVFFPIRRARGLSRFTVLLVPAMFVPCVFVCTFFITFPTFKWHLGNFAERLQLDLQVASMFLWPTWLVAAIGLAIYTWTPFARGPAERVQSESPDDLVIHDTGIAPPERNSNPYSPPHT